MFANYANRFDVAFFTVSAARSPSVSMCSIIASDRPSARGNP
jgi:hypothetical protein